MEPISSTLDFPPILSWTATTVDGNIHVIHPPSVSNKDIINFLVSAPKYDDMMFYAKVPKSMTLISMPANFWGDLLHVYCKEGDLLIVILPKPYD